MRGRHNADDMQSLSRAKGKNVSLNQRHSKSFRLGIKCSFGRESHLNSHLCVFIGKKGLGQGFWPKMTRGCFSRLGAQIHSTITDRAEPRPTTNSQERFCRRASCCYSNAYNIHKVNILPAIGHKQLIHRLNLIITYNAKLN